MIILTVFFRWFITQSLNLYPRQFRAEFGEEMEAVFLEVVKDQPGCISAMIIILRELKNLPANLIRQHLFAQGFKEIEMSSNFKRPDWFFYPGWVIANVFAIALSWFATFQIIGVVTRWVGQTIQVNGKTRITEDYLFMVIFFPTLCLLSGIFQYILLRFYLPKMGWWILATGAGCLATIAFIGLLLSVFDFATNSIWGDALVFSMIGGLFGLSQWVLLRRRIPKASWWILASMLGWGLAVLGSLTEVKNGSALAQLLTAILSPAVVASFAWWFLLNPKEGEEPLFSGS